jgi:hypothetical protein
VGQVFQGVNMPVGYCNMAEPLINHVYKTQPKRIIDLGIGFGYWGATLRNYFSGATDGHMNYGHKIIDGVEIFPQYRNPMWSLYNFIHIGDIKDFIYLLPKYDMTICIDVVEHLPKETVYQMIEKSKSLMLGVCTEMGPQHLQSPHGNPHENHVTLWTEQEFRDMGFKITTLNPLYFAAYK